MCNGFSLGAKEGIEAPCDVDDDGRLGEAASRAAHRPGQLGLKMHPWLDAARHWSQRARRAEDEASPPPVGGEMRAAAVLSPSNEFCDAGASKVF